MSTTSQKRQKTRYFLLSRTRSFCVFSAETQKITRKTRMIRVKKGTVKLLFDRRLRDSDLPLFPMTKTVDGVSRRYMLDGLEAAIQRVETYVNAARRANSPHLAAIEAEAERFSEAIKGFRGGESQ